MKFLAVFVTEGKHIKSTKSINMKLLQIMNSIITFVRFINKYTLHLYFKEKFNEFKELASRALIYHFTKLNN